MAVQNGHAECLKVLLEHNADPNQAMHSGDFAGQTPISVAVEVGNLSAISTLVDAAGITGTALITNGATDLWMACWKGHIDVVRYLVAQPNVEINRPRSDAKDDTSVAVPHPGTTPLEVAVLIGHTAIADLLKQHGAV